jgi:TonB family protein
MASYKYPLLDPGERAAPLQRDFRVVVPPEHPLFVSLEHKRSRKSAVVASTVFHGVMLVLLLLVPFLLTEQLNLARYSIVLMAPPPPKPEVLEVTPYKAPVVPKPVERLIAPPPRTPEMRTREVRRPEVIPEPKAAELEIRPKPVESVFNTPVAEAPRPAPPKEVRTNVFNESAKSTVQLPARDVQTGGFGDPNGARGQGRTDKAPNVASLGSFDLPTGEGAGNGSGGSRGARGTVASAGFGNGVATGGNTGSPRAAVQQGTFGDSQAAVPGEARKREVPPAQTPVEITYKPRPDYTPEARARKLEGEVLIKVLFSAAGEVRILNLVSGLGYGLDENATRAAKQIRFTPAMRDGKPVDSTATVHIVFQLAY